MTPWRLRIYAAIACLRGDVQASREVLPSRRRGHSIKFEFSGFKYHVGYSVYDDNRIAEVFLVSAKSGEMLRAINRDSAIAASMALQHGCPLEKLREAMGRTERGEAESPIAAALDFIVTGRDPSP
jgi:hypothetical protein